MAPPPMPRSRSDESTGRTGNTRRRFRGLLACRTENAREPRWPRARGEGGRRARRCVDRWRGRPGVEPMHQGGGEPAGREGGPRSSGSAGAGAAWSPPTPTIPASMAANTMRPRSRPPCGPSTAPAARSSTPRAPTPVGWPARRFRRSCGDSHQGDGPHDLTPHVLRVLDALGIDALHAHRRRRHAVLRPADAQRGRPGDRHPQDDGQRRPRHRLLHRVLDRGHPGCRVHPQPADQRRLARADRGRRAVRSVLAAKRR